MRRLIFVLFLVLNLSAVSADTIPARLALTDAIGLCLVTNTNLKQSQEGLQASQSRLKIESIDTTYGMGTDATFQHSANDSTMSSRVFGDLRYRNLYGTEATVDLSPVGMGNERGSVGLSLSHPLTKGKGTLSKRFDLFLGAKSDVIIQNKQLYQTRQSVVRDVVDNYFQAVLAREQVTVHERAVSSAEATADGTRKREEAGLVAGVDVGRAESRVAETKNALNRQKESARGALDKLMLAIGVGIGFTPELTDDVPEVDWEIPDVEDAIETALSNRTELMVFDVRLSTQERRLAIAEDEFRPGMNVIARLRSTSRDSGMISDSLFSMGSTNVGIEYRVPIDKRVIEEEREIVARRLSLMQEQRDFRKDEIAEQVRRAHRSLESARNSLAIYSQNLESAKERLHIAQRMMDEGEGSNREVLEAQDSLTVVEIGMLSARIGVYLAGINLKYAMGEDLTIMGSK